MFNLKKEIRCMLAAGLFAYGIGGQAVLAVNPHTDPANSGNWVLLDNVSDEFGSNALDHAKWQVCGKDNVFWANSFDGRTFNTNNTGGVPGGWQYSPNNIRVTNGVLKITTQYEPDYPWHNPGNNVYTYTTAGMWSKATFTNGYMEIRCKLAYESQTGAFWTTGSGAELDVFEAIGKHPSRQNKMWSSIHDWDLGTQPNVAWTQTSTLPFDFSDGFHTYAAEWDTNSVKIYADGVLVHEATQAWVEANGPNSQRWPMTGGQHVWADSEIFEWWAVPATNNPPSDFVVDYIRVWQKGPPQSNPWDSYINQYGLSGVHTNNADSDALDDWTEYVVGGDPTNPADVGVLPSFDASSGDYAFSLRNDASLIAYLCTASNLVSQSWMTNQTITVSVNDGAMSNYVSSVGMSEPQKFIRLLVAETNAVSPVVPSYSLIIGGATGNGDLQSGSPSAGTHSYQNTPNWFNASGAESVNAISDSATNGSSQPTGTHALLPATQRVEINDSGYTIVAAGEVFSLSYEFGASGGPSNWNGDETNRSFLFTSTAPINGNTTVADITEIGSDGYSINRAADGQWTTRTVTNFYTATAADVGKTVYFGMEFDEGTGNSLSPRIDVIKLEVNAP